MDRLDQLLTRWKARLQISESDDSPSFERTNGPPSSLALVRTLPETPALPDFAGGRGWSQESEREYAGRWNCLGTLQRAAGVPKRYQGFTWETFPGERSPELLAWPTVEGPDGRVPWAVFAQGPPGSGKTHLATAVFCDLLCRGWKGRWFEAADALEELKAEFQDEVYEGRTMKALKESEILLLDELGAEKPTEFNRERLAYVLRYRYSREKFTIISTNLTLTQLDEIDPRLSSRLGGQEAIRCSFEGGEDHRL